MPSGVSSSGGSVAHCVRECHLGVLYYKKPILVTLACLFYSLFAYKSKLLTLLGNKKPGALSYTGLLVVAGVGLEPTTFGL